MRMPPFDFERFLKRATAFAIFLAALLGVGLKAIEIAQAIGWM